MRLYPHFALMNFISSFALPTVNFGLMLFQMKATWSLFRLIDGGVFTNLSENQIELAYSLFIYLEENEWAYAPPDGDKWILFTSKKHDFKVRSKTLKAK